MLIALLGFEIVLIGLTVFTTHMVEHKFKSIQVGLEMYCSKRTYKTKADIEFIETIISEYRRLCSDTDEEPDLPSAISLKLHKEYIGRFSYVAVKNIAIKARHLMWGIWVGELLIAWINQITQEGQTLLIWSVSLFLTIIMCFYGIIKGLDEQQEALIDEVTHYIKNVYPLEVKRQMKVSEVAASQSGKKIEDQDRKATVTYLDESSKERGKKQETLSKNRKETVQRDKALSSADIAQMLKRL